MAEQTNKIFLIDDDADTQHLLQFLLSRAGYDVTLAADGEQALKLIRTSSPPMLVLLDLMMPYHDGFEILDAIKTSKHWCNVPVIILTASNNEEDIEKGFEYGMSDYISKPFKPAELIARISNALAD